MRKTLLLLLGPNGVGKSTTAQALLNMLPHTALVDGDWCRAMNPYCMDTVVANLYALLKNYFLCPEIGLVVFPYGFHGDRKQRFDRVAEKLRQDGIDFQTLTVVLMCSLEENIRRAQKDMRDDERIRRGIENTYAYYDGFTCPKIDTTDLSTEHAAKRIVALLQAACL
ncbi:MAG TPA: hypothetical protein PKE04_08790 [Clostridia bacterium]|nr:hypothetical protein [Clostridia bacterium]